MTMRARANPMRSSSLGLRRLVALRREGPNSKARKSRHDMRITPPRWAARLGAIPRRSGFVAANMIAEQLTIRLPGAPARYDFRILSRSHRPPPAGFIQPCLPTPADGPPSGPGWVHEIKHDGYRLMARRDSLGIRLLTRNGHNWADRYPTIVEAVNRLKARSCLIDGEAVVCDVKGLAVFGRRHRAPPIFARSLTGWMPNLTMPLSQNFFENDAAVTAGGKPCPASVRN